MLRSEKRWRWVLNWQPREVALDPAAVGRTILEGYLAGRKRMERIAQRPITIG